LLVPVAQARKVINRKRFLEEYERTVNNFVPDGAEQLRVNSNTGLCKPQNNPVIQLRCMHYSKSIS